MDSLSYDLWGIPGGTVVKESAYQCRRCRDTGSISELRRSPGIENGNPLQYSCLENFIDRGDGQATVHGVAKSWTQQEHVHTLHVIFTSSTEGRT